MKNLLNLHALLMHHMFAADTVIQYELWNVKKLFVPIHFESIFAHTL